MKHTKKVTTANMTRRLRTRCGKQMRIRGCCDRKLRTDDDIAGDEGEGRCDRKVIGQVMR